jgi:hypothetical protein
MQPEAAKSDFHCPDCGSSKVVSNWTPPSYSLHCAECGWAVATSRFPPIYEDTTIYRVFLVPKGSDTLRAIEAIKSNQGGTTFEAKQLLGKPEVFLLEGIAIKIFTKVENLKAQGLKIRVEPSFGYTRSDFMGMNPA